MSSLRKALAQAIEEFFYERLAEAIRKLRECLRFLQEVNRRTLLLI
nr:hypothetical protein [Tanacetum cinerariifolium]